MERYHGHLSLVRIFGACFKRKNTLSFFSEKGFQIQYLGVKRMTLIPPDHPNIHLIQTQSLNLSLCSKIWNSFGVPICFKELKKCQFATGSDKHESKMHRVTSLLFRDFTMYMSCQNNRQTGEQTDKQKASAEGQSHSNCHLVCLKMSHKHPETISLFGEKVALFLYCGQCDMILVSSKSIKDKFKKADLAQQSSKELSLGIFCIN